MGKYSGRYTSYATEGTGLPTTAPYVGFTYFNRTNSKLYYATNLVGGWEILNASYGAVNPATAPYVGFLFFNTTANVLYYATNLVGAWSVISQNAGVGSAVPGTAPYAGWLFYNTTNTKLYVATSTSTFAILSQNVGTGSGLPASAPYIGWLYFNTANNLLYYAVNTSGTFSLISENAGAGSALPGSAPYVGWLFLNTTNTTLYYATSTGGAFSPLQTILVGTALPGSAAYTGQPFVNTTNNLLYVAENTSGTFGIANEKLNQRNDNAVLNGEFQVWQSGTTWTYTTGQVGALTADRWKMDITGGSTWTIIASQQAGDLAGIGSAYTPKYTMRVNKSVAGASNPSAIYLYQQIPDVRLFSGQQVTLSYYAKANASNTINAVVYQQFGLTGVPSSLNVVSFVAQAITTSWVRYSHTFTMTSVSGKTLTTDPNIVVRFDMPVTSTSTVDIGLVQLEASPIATPFKWRGFEDTLNQCLAFYQQSFPYGTIPVQNIGNSTGALETQQAVGAAVAFTMGTCYFQVPMYAAPTMTFYNPNAANTLVRNISVGAGTATNALDNVTEKSFLITLVSAAGSAAGNRNTVHWSAKTVLS